jgi:hypothetical protein
MKQFSRSQPYNIAAVVIAFLALAGAALFLFLISRQDVAVIAAVIAGVLFFVGLHYLLWGRKASEEMSSRRTGGTNVTNRIASPRVPQPTRPTDSPGTSSGNGLK